MKKYIALMVLVFGIVWGFGLPNQSLAVDDPSLLPGLRAQVEALQLQVSRLVSQIAISQVPQEVSNICGDVNVSGSVTLDDATAITNYIFSGGTLPAGVTMSDADGNGMITISDAVYIINHVNAGGPLPKCTLGTSASVNTPVYSQTGPNNPVTYVCGDVNMNGVINNDDATAITNYIFSGGTLPAGVMMSDADGNGTVNISDAVYIINHVNAGGPAPKCTLGTSASVNTPVYSQTGPNILNQQVYDAQPTDNSSPKFTVSQKVRTIDYLNVRNQANGSSVGVVSRGESGEIVSGPVFTSGYYWWEVWYGSGLRGWSVQNWLERIDQRNGSSDMKPPVFSNDSFVSPVSVGVAQSNWWLLKAGGIPNAKFKYTVNWGDGTSNVYNGLGDRAVQAYHTYNSVGVFKATLMAADEFGNQMTRELTVEVFSSTSLNPSTKFKVGDRVRALDALNVRTRASGVVVKTMPAGSEGKVLGGPVWGIMGDWWWNIQYADATNGWSSETWLGVANNSAPDSGPVNKLVPTNPNTQSAPVLPPTDNPVSYVCGDVNMNGVINNDDATAITSYIFEGGTLPAGLTMSDADGNGMITISDAVYIINHVNAGGPAPKCTPKPVDPFQQAPVGEVQASVLGTLGEVGNTAIQGLQDKVDYLTRELLKLMR